MKVWWRQTSKNNTYSSWQLWASASIKLQLWSHWPPAAADPDWAGIDWWLTDQIAASSRSTSVAPTLILQEARTSDAHVTGSTHRTKDSRYEIVPCTPAVLTAHQDISSTTAPIEDTKSSDWKRILIIAVFWQTWLWSPPESSNETHFSHTEVYVIRSTCLAVQVRVMNINDTWCSRRWRRNFSTCSPVVMHMWKVCTMFPNWQKALPQKQCELL